MKRTIINLDFGITYVLLLCIATGVSACDTGRLEMQQGESEQAIKIRSQLDQWAEDYELMGASVILIANGEKVLSYYSGYSRIADSAKTSSKTTYRIASISKTLTTLAVLTLVEEGKVDLDEDVSTYLGWTLRNPSHPDQIITLADIMAHRSGIRDGKGYGQFISAMRQGPLHIKELFRPEGSFFTDDMFANYSVGEYFSYSNCSWGLVASVVEKMSGQRFDTYTKKMLFEPMGMKASFNVMDIPLSDIATLYRADEKRAWVAQADDVVNNEPSERAPENYELGSNGLIYGPQGSLRASAEDLYQLAKLLIYDGKVDEVQILKSKTIDAMRTNRWVYDGSNGDTWSNFWLSYGKGLHFMTNTDSADVLFPDRRMQGHPGIAYGLLSDMYVDPVTESGVIFITNGSKQAYEYGPSSSFYAVEEALFHILHPYLKAIEAK